MRARLAQHLLDSGSDDNLRSEVFLTALFAQLDRLLHKPLPELLGKLPLPGRAYDALLRETGPYNAYLEVSRAQGYPAQLEMVSAVEYASPPFRIDDIGRMNDTVRDDHAAFTRAIAA